MTELRDRVARRLALLGPGPAAFFRDACLLVDEVQAGRWPLQTVTHLVSHLLRDLESSVRRVMYEQLVESRPVLTAEPPEALLPGREVLPELSIGPTSTPLVAIPPAESPAEADDCETDDDVGELAALYRSRQFCALSIFPKIVRNCA